METDESKGGLDLGGGEAEGDPPDPFAGVEADVPAEPVATEGGLGGEGATLEELEAEQVSDAPINAEEVEDDPNADPVPLPGGEEPAAAAEPGPKAEPTPVAPDPAPEPEAAAEPASKKEGTATRPYVVLVMSENAEGKQFWSEVEGSPFVASQGEVALKQAYAELVPADSEEGKTLVVIPVHYWKPRAVAAKAKVERAVEIS